jgi:hypothetical protein
MMANDLLKQVELAQAPEAPETPNETQSLNYLISVLVAFVDVPFGHQVFARDQLLWLDIPEEERIQRHAKDLRFAKTFDEYFANAYGLPLREFLFITTVAYYRFAESSIQDQPSPLVFDSNVFFKRTADPARVQLAFGLISKSPDQLAAKLLGTARQTWATDFAPFARSPLIQIEDNKYVCPDLHLFRAFFVHGLFELIASACNGLDVKQLFGAIFGRYIERVIGGFAVESPILARTFYHPVTFVGERKAEACEGMFVWPSMTILMEYKAGMLTARQRCAASIEETIKGIDDLLAKQAKNPKGVGQLVKSMVRILTGE